MKRHATTDAMAEARFGALLEETLLPTPNSTELIRTGETDYLMRLDQRAPHVAELFQENTKYTPYSTVDLEDESGDLERRLRETKDWYMSTPYRIPEDYFEEGGASTVRLKLSELKPGLAALFGHFSKTPAALMLYSVDLMVAHRGRLYRLVPNTDFVWFEKELSDREMTTLRSSILRQPAEALSRADAYLFVVAVPWRYMLFLGPRGYRHMMLEAGSLIGQVGAVASKLQLAPLLCLDFYDARVDKILLLDGTERTTMAIFILQGETI